MSFGRIVPRLLAGFLLLSLLPLAGLAYIYIQAFEQSLTETALTNLASVANKKADQIDDYINERLANSRLLSKLDITRSALLEVSQDNSARYRDYFLNLFDSVGYYDLLLTDRAGNVVFSIRQEADFGSNLNTGPYRDSALARAHREAMALLDTQITPVAPYAPSNDKPAIFVVTPVLDQGHLIGTVALQLDLNRLTKVSKDATGLGKSGETVLSQIDGDDVLYVAPLDRVPDAAFRYRVPLSNAAPPMRAALTGHHGQGLTRDYVGTEIIAVWRHLPALHWGMVVKIDANEALEAARQLRSFTLGILAMVLLLASTLALLFGRGLVGPIRALTTTTRRIAAGQLEQRVAASGCDEFRELAGSFNRMADLLEAGKSQLEQRVEDRTRELQQSMARYDALIEQIPVGVYAFRIRTDGSMAFEYVSPRFCRTLNLAAEDILADASVGFAAVHPDDLEGFTTLNRENARTLSPFLWEGRFVIDGATRWMHIESTPTPKTNGDSVWNGIMYDITERKQTEAVLFEAKQAAEAANRAKSAFLANMSHEIRTPMNAILGLTQLVLETSLEPRQQDFLNKALNSGRALLAILNDILDYSKIEAGRLAISRLPFSVETILHEVANLFSALLEGKGLKLVFDLAPDLPATVLGDALRLNQVLNNLIGNAIKFTAHGEIRVRVEVVNAASTDETLTLCFAVRDTGIGIDQETAHHLFQPFMQADDSITRKYGGTGLGLAISRTLVELMGGEISATGTPGAGATFTFTIRIGRSDDTRQAYAQRQQSALAVRHFAVANLAADQTVVTDLLEQLRPYLEEHELVPDDLLKALHPLAQAARTGPLFTQLLRHINDFNHDAALATLTQITALANSA